MVRIKEARKRAGKTPVPSDKAASSRNGRTTKYAPSNWKKGTFITLVHYSDPTLQNPKENVIKAQRNSQRRRPRMRAAMQEARAGEQQRIEIPEMPQQGAPF